MKIIYQRLALFHYKDKMENYFNLIPFDMLVLIGEILNQTEFAYLALVLNDYQSRKYL